MSIFVSIHVPARGTTTVYGINATNCTSFNPRSRTGNDVIVALVPASFRTVSIHVPARGTTAYHTARPPIMPVSIHVPARGTTLVIV